MATTDTTQKELQEQLDSLRKDLADINQTVKRLASDYAEEGKARVRASANRAQERVKATLSDVKGALEDVESEIQSRPLTSTLIAFGIGLVLGRILKR
jgi:ElaB/YqjD/DUF883 family membrane-anchored ribosome-binding protein